MKSYAPIIARELKAEPRTYKGIVQKTDTLLHDQIVDYIRSYFQGKSLRILDWGAGEGALSERLADEGHSVVALDINAESWKGQNVRFLPMNFNVEEEVSKFTEDNKGEFDLVISAEVIEHVENPWSFIRNLKKLDCDIIITTPNISSWWSRFWFLLTGEIWGFRDSSWIDPGHINPLSAVELRNMFKDVGLRIVAVMPGGRLPIIWLYNAKRFIISIFMAVLRPFMSGYKDGWALICHVKPARGT